MAEIFAVLERLNRETGTTIVMVEHRVDELAHLVSRVVMMDKGAILFDGTPRVAFSRRRGAHWGESHIMPVSAWFPQAAEFALALSDSCGAVLDTDDTPLDVGDAVTIEPATLRTIEEDAQVRQRAARADLVITFAHRRRDVVALLPDTPVAAVTFIPAATTRQALAALDPRVRIGVVSVFPEFTPLMKAGVRRFAPHVSAVSVALYGTPELASMLHRVDVVVFATGADDLGLVVPDCVTAFEYRHTPDAGDVRRLIGPLYEDASAETLKTGDMS